jgi:predicted lipoprotein with Yx(FWY)xxD motif
VKEDAMKNIIILIVATVALVAPASAQTARLVDGMGRTLYTNANDTVQASNCNGQCAVDWPPHLAAPDATFSGNWSLVARQDGHKQWVYRGKPLYRNKNDVKAGDTAGSGVAGWTIATQ